MQDTTLQPRTESSDDAIPYALPLELTVKDPEVIAELWARAEGEERDDYALAALRLGVLALRQARGQLDADTLRREGDRLLGDVQQHLVQHRTHLDQALSGVLKEYFDPQSGRFNERVERLLKKDGELETLLSRKITAEDSELCRALAALTGRESPLFKLLSPNESDGLLSALQKSVADELEGQRKTVLKEFSLDNQEGALSRLVQQMTENNGLLKKDLQGRIDDMIKEFSFDDDNSALSRMKKTVDATSATITRHLTLDDETSALSRLRRELLGLFKEHGEGVQKFHEEVRVALETLKARREEAAASTRHGVEFEAAVFSLLQQEAQRKGDIATAVGNTTGQIRNCKKGDSLIELGPDSFAPEAKIVIEAKESSSYSLKDALVEIAEARENRQADIGIFVFSRATAPAGLDPLVRYGDDIVAVWDRDDPATDLYLTLALDLARALCTRKACERKSLDVDFGPIDVSLNEISTQVEELDKIRTWAETIKNSGDKIIDRLRISREKIQKKADLLREHMENLKGILESAASSSN